MNKPLQNIEKRWQTEEVKYKRVGKGLKWQKTLRTADCAICKEHVIEEKEDQSFINWALLLNERDRTGRAPEICPTCIKKIHGDIIPAPRFAECRKCKVRQREKIYGVGWPGWKQMVDDGRRQPQEIIRNLICPNCTIELAKLLGEKFVRRTWTALTYASGSLLTSTKMTQNQANFAALGAGDSGAPDVYNLKSGTDTNKAGSPAVGDIYIATDTNIAYVCYSAGTWSIAGDPGQDKKNLVVKVNASNPTYQIDIDADALQVDDKSLTSVNLTASITSSGANGLDTGSEAANTWYSIWVIFKPTTNTTASLLSTSATSPTMPSGYTKKRRVGWVRNNASSNFLKSYRVGNWVWWDIHKNVLDSAAPATSYTDIACTTVAPSTSEALIIGAYVADADERHASITFRRNGSSEDGSNDLVFSHYGTSVTTIYMAILGIYVSCDGSQIIEYKVAAGDNLAKVNVQAYYDPI